MNPIKVKYLLEEIKGLGISLSKKENKFIRSMEDNCREGRYATYKQVDWLIIIKNKTEGRKF